MNFEIAFNSIKSEFQIQEKLSDLQETEDSWRDFEYLLCA